MTLFTIFVVVVVVMSAQSAHSQQVFDVTKYGADVKGVNKCTDAVKKAIDAAVNVGGGVVHFPDGRYLSGPIHLKSNITLHLADNATILFSKDFDDYLPMVTVRWEGTVLKTFSPFIYAYKQENIAIKGKGVLEGHGLFWFDYYLKLVDEYKKTKKRPTKYQELFVKLNNLTEIAAERIDMSRVEVGFLRPPFIQPYEVKNFLMEDVTVKNSPFWNINPVFCENVTIKGVKVKAPYTMYNTDGIDPDSCKDVLITGCEVDVGDDCIAIKSGRDLQGRRIGRPTENVLITNCTILQGVAAVAIGSEQSGGVKNVTVRDCVFKGTDRGLYIKSTRGRGGIVEKITFKNISMTNIKYQAITLAMSLWWTNEGKGNKSEPFSDRTPIFRDIKFEDIRAEAKDPKNSVIFSGLPESLISNVEINGIEIVSKSGLSENYTTNLIMKGYSQKAP